MCNQRKLYDDIFKASHKRFLLQKIKKNMVNELSGIILWKMLPLSILIPTIIF